MKQTYLLPGIIALAGALPAISGTVTYTDQATWLAQVSSVSTYDGGTLAAGSVQTYNTSSGLILTDLQIVGYSGAIYDLQRVNANASQTWYQWGSGTIVRSGLKPDAGTTVYIRINFTNPVSAFGFQYGGGGSGGTPANVTIVPQGLTSVAAVTGTQPNWNFYGVTSDSTTFSYVDIYMNDVNRYLVLDNISTGTYSAQAAPAETAEPGTLLQIALGAGLVVFAARRRSSAGTGPAAA